MGYFESAGLFIVGILIIFYSQEIAEKREKYFLWKITWLYKLFPSMNHEFGEPDFKDEMGIRLSKWALIFTGTIMILASFVLLNGPIQL